MDMKGDSSFPEEYALGVRNIRLLSVAFEYRL